MYQSRQFIVHGHVSVNGTKVTAPSYLVDQSLEGSVGFVNASAFIDEMHPERIQEEKR